jgi:hypothetical protein
MRGGAGNLRENVVGARHVELLNTRKTHQADMERHLKPLFG